MLELNAVCQSVVIGRNYEQSVRFLTKVLENWGFFLIDGKTTHYP